MTDIAAQAREMLASCPFCGCTPVVDPWHGGGPDKHMVSCRNDDCPAMPGTTGETKAEAIAAWNTRQPVSGDVVERARQAMVSLVFERTQPNRGDVFSWFDDHAEAIARAALEAASLQGEGWMPIESAPRDGTRVLLWLPSGRNGYAATASFRDYNIGSPDWRADSGYSCDHATHWRPLPSPPSHGEG